LTEHRINDLADVGVDEVERHVAGPGNDDRIALRRRHGRALIDLGLAQRRRGSDVGLRLRDQVRRGRPGRVGRWWGNGRRHLRNRGSFITLKAKELV